MHCNYPCALYVGITWLNWKAMRKGILTMYQLQLIKGGCGLAGGQREGVAWQVGRGSEGWATGSHIQRVTVLGWHRLFLVQMFHKICCYFCIAGINESKIKRRVTICMCFLCLISLLSDSDIMLLTHCLTSIIADSYLFGGWIF